MQKFCIFCGRKPSQKTKEHVIPYWLLKMTGNPNRKVFLGYDLSKIRFPKRYFTFDKFTFPSCDKCNNEFGKLEDYAKEVVEKLLVNERLSELEITILLDWFDKIRVGLWLAYFQLDKNPVGIHPNFYIRQRLRCHDRMLALYQSDYEFKGVVFSLTQTPAFQMSPSCFMLIINKIFFFNISSAFLFSRRLGLPFPEKILLTNGGQIKLESYKKGIHRIMKPLLRRSLITPSVEIYQPIVPINAYRQYPEYYNSEYVENSLLSSKQRLGKIFINNNNNLYKLEDEMQLTIPVFDSLSLERKIVKQTLDFQILLLEQAQFDDALSKESVNLFKKNVRSAKEVN